jgi:hypothetical protein
MMDSEPWLLDGDSPTSLTFCPVNLTGTQTIRPWYDQERRYTVPSFVRDRPDHNRGTGAQSKFKLHSYRLNYVCIGRQALQP